MLRKQRALFFVVVPAVIIAGLWVAAYWFVGFNLDFLTGMVRSASVELRGGTSFSDIAIVETPQAEQGEESPEPTPTPPQFLGFEKALYALGLDRPTTLAFAPDGTLYVLELSGNALALRDSDGDGVADQRWTFASGFSSPMGIAFQDDLVYIASRGKVTVLRDSNGDGRAETARDIITGLPAGRHQTDSLAFGPDGKLYISQGSRSDRGETPIHPLEAAILRANPDGSDLEVFATGLRNPWDFAFHPETGELFVADNGQDFPPSGVPEELNLVVEGGNYGWPNCWGQNQGPACQPDFVPSLADLEEHSSADGMVFYTGDQFPPEYKDNIFIALWGANSGDPRIGKKILRVVLSGESPDYQAEVSTFATGFGNPLDITVGPDGALYITDFGRGEIVKIYAGYGQ